MSGLQDAFMAGLLALALLPAGTAYHLSIGYEDAVGVQGWENRERPSVPSELWERGTRADCQAPPDGMIDWVVDDLVILGSRDPFCGRLRYHPGTDFAQESPPDQDHPFNGLDDPLDRLGFDVVMTSYVGTYGQETCLPWCLDGAGAGLLAYETVHALGYEVGVVEDDEEVVSASDRGWQRFNAELLLPNAGVVGQDASGLWTADGWSAPLHDVSFVAFLVDVEREPIDQARLSGIVAELKQADRMAPGALARVCGYAVDADLTGSARTSRGCELPFEWRGWDQGPPRLDSYRDPCGAPGYVCGPVTAAWQAELVCQAATGACTGSEPAHEAQVSPPGTIPRQPAAGSQTPARAGDSTLGYRVWHFVAAPTPSACQGHRAPGFDVETSFGVPYLAHDLDIYAPATQALAIEETDTIERSTLEEAQRTQDLGLEALDLAARAAWREAMAEPNSAHGVGPWEETSRTYVDIPRSADDPCFQLGSLQETPDTVDPWVDILDARAVHDVTRERTEGEIGAYPASSPWDPLADTDSTNRPGPAQIRIEGKVGVFADKDDDRIYDQAPWAELWEGVKPVGAYPLFWDLWLDEAGEPSSELGCTPTSRPVAGIPGGEDGLSLSEHMSFEGYGQRTGLITAVYQHRPTIWSHETSGRVVVPQQTPGGAITVLMSQGLHRLYAGTDGAGPDPYVRDVVERLVDGITAYVTQTLERPAPGVHLPGQDRIEAEGAQSDLEPQCGLPTGGFQSAWTFGHACPGLLGCSGDTMVTVYVRDGGPQPQLETQPPFWIDVFAPGGEPVAWDGRDLWVDVDPLDGDPSRNR